MVVLFNDQSGNVRSVTPYMVEFRLVTAGEVKLTGTPLGIATYANWHRVEFHH